MRRWALMVLCATLLLSSKSATTLAQSPPAAGPWRTVTPERLLTPNGGDWLSARRTYDLTASSPLTRIGKGNVGQLRSVWGYSVQDAGTWSIAPLVVNGVMYIVEGGGRVTALDAVSGDLLWTHRRNYPEDISLSQAFNRSRGLAMAGDVIYWGTADAYVVALDGRSGKLLWETKTGDYRIGEGHDHPALVAEGKVFIGQSGGDRGAPGKFTALDAATGRILWTMRTAPAAGEPGYETWAGAPEFAPRGAAPWNTVSYDPDLRLVYFGTGQPGPWSSAVRGGGDALYANTILALDAQTGKIRWHFQVVPGDDWDRAVFESMLVDLTIKGQRRKALIATSKIGWGLVLDRATGEFLNAFPTAYDNVVTGWTTQGRPIMDPAMKPKPEDVGSEKTFLVCPTFFGARNLNAAAFSPRTQLYYLGVNNNCQQMRVTPVTYRPGRNFTGVSGAVVKPPGYDHVGEFVAFDPVTGKRRWTYKAPNGAGMSASAMTTASGLVFGGTVDRQFFALDEANGKLLWQTRLSGDVSGSPVTYEVNGRQYIAVPSGGRSLSAAGMAPLSNITLPQGGGAIWVFALPSPEDLKPFGPPARSPAPVITSGVARPPAGPPAQGAAPAPAAAALTGLFTLAQAARGEAVFRTACSRCHTAEQLGGAGFRARWGGGPAADVFNLIATTMPQDNPGSLNRQAYADVVAYLLRESGYRAHGTELPAHPAGLAAVQLTAPL